MFTSFACDCEEESSRILFSQPLPSREPWVTSQGVERFLHRDPAGRKEEISDQRLAMTCNDHQQTNNTLNMQCEVFIGLQEEGTDIVSSQPLPMRSQKLRLSARTARAAALQEAPGPRRGPEHAGDES